MKKLLCAVPLLLALSCASRQKAADIPKEPNPMRLQAAGETSEPPPLEVVFPVYDFPADSGAPQAPAPEGLALVALQSTSLEIKPKREFYRGGAVVYPWLPNQVYQVFTAVEKLTNIQLEPGEELVSPPASGNTEVFAVSFTYSQEGGKRRPQVYVMPYLANKSTTLFINTTKRTYSVMVYSYPVTFMPLVSFTYPLEIQEAMRREIENNSTDIPISGSLTSLDFGYDIIPHSPFKPHWMPSLVFNDGVKTYIYFPSAVRASYAPVLFEVNSKNERVIVNYRVKGTYFIVDRLLSRAELVLDVNEGNIVTLRRK